MERIESTSSSCSCWFSSFSALSKPTKIALAVFTALGAGLMYLAAKNLQGRDISWNCLGSLPVSKRVAGIVAGIAILGVGGYYLWGSGKTAGAEKKKVEPIGDNRIRNVPFDIALPNFVRKAVLGSKEPYSFESFNNHPGGDWLSRRTESIYFFRHEKTNGVRLKLQVTDSGSLSSASKVISAFITCADTDNDQKSWSLFLDDGTVQTFLEDNQTSTIWDPKESSFLSAEPEQLKDGVSMNLDQMLYAWLTGKSCTIANGLKGDEARSWSLSLVKTAASREGE